VIVALAALLPADIVIRSELPAKLEHFVAYSGTAVMCGFVCGAAIWRLMKRTVSGSAMQAT
jgi:hypothetical protein